MQVILFLGLLQSLQQLGFFHIAVNHVEACMTYSAESQEVIDAELAARVLRLVNVADSGLHNQV